MPTFTADQRRDIGYTLRLMSHLQTAMGEATKRLAASFDPTHKDDPMPTSPEQLADAYSFFVKLVQERDAALANVGPVESGLEQQVKDLQTKNADLQKQVDAYSAAADQFAAFQAANTPNTPAVDAGAQGTTFTVPIEGQTP